jgi:hypothetical protein
MNICKRVLNPQRLRQIPEHFSWIDHRLVRERTLERADTTTWALYLFLVTVADVQGLSYYSDASIVARLQLNSVQLTRARLDLISLSLIAYDPPLYQVLSLPSNTPVATHLARLHAVLEGAS